MNTSKQITIKSKDELKDRLSEFGIKICLSKGVGYNSFTLIYEQFGFFCVNAKPETDYNKVKLFRETFGNVNILIGH